MKSINSINALKDLKWLKTSHPQYAFLRKSVYELETNQWRSNEQQHLLTTHSLANILNHCKQNVAFYKETLQDIDCNKISLDDFSKLPILTKDQIRENSSALIANHFKQPDGQKNMHAFHTSGSTGTPMKVYRGMRNIIYTQAISLHYHLAHQRDFDLRNVNIVTSSKYNLSGGYWASNIQTGPGYKVPISERSSVIFDHLIKLQPHYIQTHPSTLKRLIDISVEKGQRIDSLREVRTFGEILEPNVKSACSENWQVALSNNYSSEEFATIAFSCPENDHFHVMSDSVHLEVVDEYGKSCAPGELGRILVTQLKNFAMPLIRYEIGDMGTMGHACSCGRSTPVLKRLEGRVRNLVVLPDGDTFHPIFDEAAMLAISPIKRYQVIQKKLDVIEINILGKALSSEKESDLEKVFCKTFKNNTQFTYSFVYHDDLPFSKRNKFEIFKSEVIL
jgi:phenylacetate-CoA ligase